MVSSAYPTVKIQISRERLEVKDSPSPAYETDAHIEQPL